MKAKPKWRLLRGQILRYTDEMDSLNQPLQGGAGWILVSNWHGERAGEISKHEGWRFRRRIKRLKRKARK